MAVGRKRGIDDAERVTPTNAATNVACTLNLHCAGAAPIPLPHWILRILSEYGQQQQQRGHQVKLVVAASQSVVGYCARIKVEILVRSHSKDLPTGARARTWNHATYSIHLLGEYCIKSAILDHQGARRFIPTYRTAMLRRSVISASLPLALCRLSLYGLSPGPPPLRRSLQPLVPLLQELPIMKDSVTIADVSVGLS